jgi:PTH1 family peptidyl-tRNA hydrolase
VVGLGNAERQYERTRHNVGARAVSAAASQLGLKPSPGLVPIPMSRSGIVLPDGFMNDSGGLVYRAVERWRPSAQAQMLVHDDMDLPHGEEPLKEGGGHGGHNGLRDDLARLGNANFQRLRIGVGRPLGRADAADYVLATFRPEEREPLERALEEATPIILAFRRNEPAQRFDTVAAQ